MDAGRRKIWHLMLRKFESQVQFAHALGVNAVEINKIFHGRRKINNQDVAEIAVLLNCKAPELSVICDPGVRKLKRIL